MKKIIEMLQEKKTKSDNKLTIAVIDDILEYNETDEDILNYLKDVINYGCVSGIVSSLIYYTDTEKFFDDFSNEILELLDVKKEKCESYESQFSKNNLSWFAYEEICRQLYYSIEK